jgi:hypothetical protein
MDFNNPDLIGGFAIFFFIALSIIARHRQKPYLKPIAWFILITFGLIIPTAMLHKLI